MDTEWICTQAVAFDDQSTIDVGTVKNFGCIILNDKADDEKYILHEGDNTIGRHPLNSIYLEHPSVSMYHAVIQCDSEGIVLLDKGSLNKTKLNKKTLRKDVAYFLDEDSSLLFGEVQANYYVDVENSNIDNKTIKNECGSKDCITENANSSKFKTSNTATQLTKPINDCKNYEFINCQLQSLTNGEGDISSKAVLHNSKTSTITIKSNLQNALSNTNPSSPSDELLLDALSQVETNECTILDREDTLSPVLDLRDQFSDSFPALKITNCTEEELITTLNDGNDDSKFDVPDGISREDTPSPVIDLGLVGNSESTLSTQYNDSKINNHLNDTNSSCEDTQIFELENDIFDCPTQMQMTVESASNEQTISSGLQVTKQFNCSTIESTSNLHSDETQIPDINYCSPHKNIEFNEQRGSSKQNVTNVLDEETQIFHIDNDGLFDCSQQEVIESKLTNSSQNKHNKKENENENIAKLDVAVKPNTSSFHETETQIVSLDDDFFDCPTQKVIATKDPTANTSKTSEKDMKASNKSNTFNTLNTSMFSEMDTQLAELDDDFFDCPTQKIISTKVVCSEKKTPKPLKTTSLIKSGPSAFNEMDTQICEFDGPFVGNKSQSEIDSKQADFGLVVQSNKLMNKKNKTGNDNFFDCPTQKLCIPSANNVETIPCTSVQTRDIAKGVEFKSKFNLHEADTQNVEIINDNETKENCNKYVNTFEADDDDIFNCLTQKVVKPSNNESVCVKKCNPNGISVTKSILSEDCNKSEATVLEDDFFNCPTQKISHSKVDIVKTESTAQNNTNSNNHFEADDDDIFSGLTNKASTSKQIFENRTHDDVFKCPSQKFALKKNVDIHDAETQAISFGVKSQLPNATTSKHCSLDKNDINQTFEMDDDDDFFNCPTQKLPSTKNTSLSYGVNFEHASDISINKKPNTDPISITNKKKNSFDSNDDDFFNCLTQKVTCSKTAISTSSNIHLAETQLNDFHPIKPVKSSAVTFSQNIIVHNISGIDSTTLDDEDMFNCPTQKLSTLVSTNSLKNVSVEIHEEETQIVLDSDQLNATSFNTRKIINEEETQVTNMCENDFFDCQTQKVLTNNENKLDRIPNKAKNNSVERQVEAQHLTEDDDIFNCPTQKIPQSCKNKSSPTNMSKTTIHEAETLQLSSSDKLDNIFKSNSNTFGDQISDEDDDFFVCPTQKITPKNRVEPTPSSLTWEISNIHELETQIASPIKLHKFTMPITCTSNNERNDEGDDFFNCATQKVSLNCNIKPTKSSTTNGYTNKIDMHEAETQLSTSPLKSDNCANINTSRDQISDEDNDIFNFPTQKVSLNFHVKPTTSNITKETVDMHKAKTKQLSSPIKFDNFSKSQNDDDDFFNCPTQKIIFKENKTTVVDSKNINEEETQCFDFDNDNDNFTSNNLGNTINVPETSKTSAQTGCSNKSKSCDLRTLKRNISSIGVDQKDIIAKSEKCSLAGNSKTSSVPLIRIRNDLHASGEHNKILKLSNKPNKTIQNDSCTSDIKLGTENSNSPRRSKRSFKGKFNHYGLIDTTSIIKQEPTDSDLVESRVSSTSKNTPLLKQMDESIYSPFNIVNTSNTIVDSTIKSKVDNNFSLPNSESSTSNDAVKWQSFWNKKKSRSLESKRYLVGQSTSKVVSNDVQVVSKQRYQTRAVTKKEIICEDISRKRKLDLPSEESNKRICNDEKQCQLRILDKKPEHFIVTFSHLKSRHLQSMKEFVEKTGGFITDEITQCTILVADKIRCTMKILSAIARGCPIVTTSWIKHSYAVKEFQDVDDFIIKDNDAERKYNFQLTESLSRARTKGLLDGYAVLITPSVKPRDMKVIVTCAGGTHVLSWPKTHLEKALIVTCEHDRQHWKAIWDIKGALTIDSDILVTSIIRQRLYL